MEKENFKLTSAEIGTLWAQYINGTAVDIINKHMVSIIEDEKIKALFEKGITVFDKQKNSLLLLLKMKDFQFQLDLLILTLIKEPKDFFRIYFVYITYILSPYMDY